MVVLMLIEWFAALRARPVRTSLLTVVALTVATATVAGSVHGLNELLKPSPRAQAYLDSLNAQQREASAEQIARSQGLIK